MVLLWTNKKPLKQANPAIISRAYFVWCLFKDMLDYIRQVFDAIQ